ncbi:MAG: SRPBCC family protein [Deltaproteobacteria bacterium]|nr:SRPBCC family protein [Deltaproteobacteria bacterium]
MLASSLVPALLLLVAAAGPPRAHIPAEVRLAELLPLTAAGEVGLLPEHDRQPFNAVIVTRATEPCDTVAHSMLDVESYPSRFNVKRAHILEKSEAGISYELELNIAFAPRVPGHVRRAAYDRVVYDDLQTGAQFIYTLHDVAAGCAVTYSLLETPGKASGWVGVVRALEASAVDAANFAAGLSSVRGFAKPERARAPMLSPADDRAFAALARHGTALRVVREQGRFPVMVARRVVDVPFEAARAAVEDRAQYPKKIEVLRRAEAQDGSAAYHLAAFGGQVAWRTAVATTREAQSGLLTIVERVVGGDLPAGAGRWVWRLRPITGGTDVELSWDLDLTAGSAILNAIASTDPAARESLALQMALSLMGHVVGGRPLGPTTLASMP